MKEFKKASNGTFKESTILNTDFKIEHFDGDMYITIPIKKLLT